MQIQDQNGTDITAELTASTSKEESATLLSPTNVLPHGSAIIVPDVDPTFAALTAHHAAQHVCNDVPQHVPEEPAAAYIATPGEIALNAALGMVAQHVEYLFKQTADLDTRLKALEHPYNDNTGQAL